MCIRDRRTPTLRLYLSTVLVLYIIEDGRAETSVSHTNNRPRPNSLENNNSNVESLRNCKTHILNEYLDLGELNKYYHVGNCGGADLKQNTYTLRSKCT